MSFISFHLVILYLTCCFVHSIRTAHWFNESLSRSDAGWFVPMVCPICAHGSCAVLKVETLNELFYRGTNTPKWDESRKAWCGRVSYTDNAGRRKQKRYTCKAKTKRAATEEYRAWLNELEAQTQSDLKRGAGAVALSEFSVIDYATNYVDMREATRAIEASTIKGYRTALRYIADSFSNTQVGNLQSSDVENWIAMLTQRGLSSSSVGKAYRLLKMIMNDAVNNGAIDRNPLDTVKPPKRGNKYAGINALDTGGRVALLDRLESMELCPVVVAAYFALFTGMRNAEICALQWRDMDISNRVIWVNRSLGAGKGGAYLKQAKTDKRRDVALPDTLIRVLERWKDEQRKAFSNNMATFNDSAYIIGDPLGFYQPNRLSREWHTLAKMFNVRGVEGRYIKFHDLRHTWATLFLAGGGDVNTAASNLGHAKPSMTLDVYASADPDAKKRSAAITEKAMRNAEGLEL